MNHNGWIDRFENDDEADLPYRATAAATMFTAEPTLGPKDA